MRRAALPREATHEPLAAIPWHALARDVVERQLKATEAGLAATDAAARLRRYGRNVLPHTPPTGLVPDRAQAVS